MASDCFPLHYLDLMSHPEIKEEEEHDFGYYGGGIRFLCDPLTVHELPYLGEVCRIRESMRDKQVLLTKAL
jgi:hypothetical protein